jgi:signal transduction histidine kinase
MRSMPLQRLLVLVFAPIALLALVPIIAFNDLDTRRLLERRAQRQLDARADVTAARIDDDLRQLIGWAEALAAAPTTRSHLPAARTASDVWAAGGLAEDLLRVEALDGAFVATRQERIVVAAGETPAPAALAASDAFSAALAGRPAVRALPGEDGARVLVLVPVRGHAGVLGVVGLDDDVDRYAPLLAADRDGLGPGSYGRLFDDEGAPMLDGRQPVPGPAPAASAAGIERVRGADEPTAATAATRLQRAPWTYRLVASARWISDPVARQTHRFLMFAAGLAALFALVAALLARYIARPFSQLETVLLAWAGGVRGVRVEVSATRDGRRLGEAFNQMAGQLERYERGLRDMVDERTAALEAAQRELELFTYSASHDLRGPLRSIDGFADELAEDYGESLPPAARDVVARIQATVGRTARLVDDLLAFGRASRQNLCAEEVDLSVMATDILAELRNAEPGRQVEATVAPGLRATADPTLIRAALDNLLRNAWKFTSLREVAHIEVGRTEAPGPAFYVRDDGAGFDMAHAGELFVAFRRLHSSREFPGTGIGLATVQRIVERHGGRVWAVGAPGAGATFYFTLPPPG